MTGEAAARAAEWRCAGLRWDRTGPALAWQHPLRGRRASPLSPGRPLAFTTGARRSCVGVRRGDRHTPCPSAAEVSVTAASAQCADCARLDRSYSVAADTRTDDTRPYDVYLAWFGPGLTKVGITAAEREGVRLLEQAALSFTLLGRGPLMAARRAEAVLGAALGVPDRIPYAAKRGARLAPPPPRERAAELETLYGRARELPGWPESLEALPCAPVHHDEIFGLGRIRSLDGVVALAPGSTVAGTVEAVAGPDVHLRTPDGRMPLLDARRLAGWALSAAAPGSAMTAEVRPLPAPTTEPERLF
ncbi:DUF2797 domain-containing protein [Streptomyces sp. SAJ15]|uniref:DUF2797 domain-containing protein n=1 Tax=Streptomyces sp. SAJ15 TaxID=2011095 RepID=UPI001185D45F|nr:DUF2797 domain-containing protein [Streptomyces sp. SAJ15]TVL93325.1 hypothetical protein CD790_09510 [Streptomyces sp. SAJ15]